MKINLLYLSIIVLFFGCKSNNTSNKEALFSQSYLRSLTENNKRYFKREYPQKYMYIIEYVNLLKVDELVNSIINQIDSNNIDTTTLNVYIELMNKYSLTFFDKSIKVNLESVKNLLIQPKQMIDKDKIKNELLLNLYITGNEFIKQYNYSFFRMTKARVVVVPKSQQASVGNIYEADIEFSCSDVRPFIVIVEGDTLDYKNGVPYYKTIREHKGNIIKKGVLLTYNVGRGDYVDFPFEFEINVK